MLFNNEETTTPIIEATPEVVTEAPKKVKKKKVAAEVTEVSSYLPLDWIVSNDLNPRTTTGTTLVQQGYGIFKPVEGSDKPSLVSLARGTDADKGLFVSLLEKNDEKLVNFSKVLTREGQVSAVSVVKIEDGKYDLVIGCRRFLALLYVSLTGNPNVRIKCVDVTGRENLADIAASENIWRENMSPIEIAKYLRTKQINPETGKKRTNKELSELTNINDQTCRNYLLLLELETSKKLVEVEYVTINPETKQKMTVKMTGAEMMEKIHSGEIPEYVGRNIVVASKKAAKVEEKKVITPGERHRAPNLKELTEQYNTKEIGGTWTEQVREWVAEVIQVTYTDFPTTKKSNEKPAE